LSTNLECRFVERKPGHWFYLLESGWAENAFDWREEADVYGPFDTQEQAYEHLRDNHANPGGFWVMDHQTFVEDEVYKRKLDTAISPTGPSRGW